MLEIPNIITAGDNCMDVYDKDHRFYPGGNPVNVAVYIKRLGGNAAYIGAVGTDAYGEQMKKALEEKNIDISRIKTLPGETAVSHIEIQNGERCFGDYSEGVMAEFSLDQEDLAFIRKFDLYLSGIWGHTENKVQEIHSMGTTVAFDFATKWRDPIVNNIIAQTDYAFFAYDEEVLRETGITDYRSFMKEKKEQGAGMVIVTLGEKGSIAWDGTTFREQGIVNCQVVDTMGAGDSYIAGFMYARLKGADIGQAMEAGARNSAITIGYSGAW